MTIPATIPATIPLPSPANHNFEHALSLGEYRLGRVLGCGGMGTVFLGKSTRNGRLAAVKVLSAESERDPEQVRCFMREIATLCSVEHRNIIRLVDADPYGVMPYLAMEFAAGKSVRAMVQAGGALSVELALDILIELCGALSAVHRQGFLHRDVKPANIVAMAMTGRPVRVKLIDFGLAVSPAVNAKLNPEVILGTPAFISPEAIRTPTQVGVASDIYSLGAVAYFLVTGRDIFSGTTAVEVCRSQLFDTPVPVSLRVPSPIPAAFETLIMECVAKDPGGRPSDIAEVERCLRTIRAHRASFRVS